MSYDEFLGWVIYRRQRGSLHPGLRIDHAGALIAAMLGNIHRAKGAPPHRVADYLPYAAATEQSDDDFEAFVQAFAGDESSDPGD